MIHAGLRAGTVTLTVTFALTAASSPIAGAISPPHVDSHAAPPPGSAGPVAPMAQQGACTTAGVLPGSDPAAMSPNEAALNLPAAWKYGRGDGQLVAVIDTGVRPGPRLPNVNPGGDFVATTDGLTDCDGHGTLVAGLIAGQPSADGFSGVAPGARVLSIRQTSARFAPRNPGDDPVTTRVAIDVATLGRSVVRAADLGAKVIDISAAACLPAGKSVDEAELGAALRYAALDKDAVIVAAAGDNGAALDAGAACPSNPLGDAAHPADPRNWTSVTSVSIPSWWQPYVLSVGALDPAARPSAFTMAGPWVGVAAPGENVASVGNGDGGGLANALPNERGDLSPVSGTGYAAAYVSGVAALVRSRFPQLTAEQVVRRITVSAHGAARSPST